MAKISSGKYSTLLQNHTVKKPDKTKRKRLNSQADYKKQVHVLKSPSSANSLDLNAVNEMNSSHSATYSMQKVQSGQKKFTTDTRNTKQQMILRTERVRTTM